MHPKLAEILDNLSATEKLAQAVIDNRENEDPEKVKRVIRVMKQIAEMRKLLTMNCDKN